MAYENKPLEQATRDELDHYARKVLNLDIMGRPSRDTLILKIRESGHEADTIKVAVSSDEAEATAAQRFPPLPKEFSGKRTWVTLRADPSRPGGRAPHPVQINGHCITIKRGIKVALPDEFLQALEDAVETDYDWSEEHGLHNDRPNARFSYIIHGPLRPEEYETA